MANKLILKIALLVVLVIVVQQVYYRLIGSYIPEVQKTSRMDFRFEKESVEDYDLVFIASSINFTTAKTDTDKRDMAQMIDDAIDGCAVLDVSRGGNNVELYDEITQRILDHKSTPTMFIYEVSIRTFAPVYNEPANARSLKDDEVIFRDDVLTSFYHALNVFRYDFGIDSEKEYNKMVIYDGTEAIGPLDEFMKKAHPSGLTVPEKKFLINYMGRVTEGNPKFKALKKLVNLIKKNDLDAFFLIPPENYRQGMKHFPEKFEKEFDANVSLVKSLLDKEDIPFIDLSKSLGSKRFTHTAQFPNGHLDQRGRQFVADKITAEIICPSSN